MSLVGEELGQGGEGTVWAVPDQARLLEAFELRIGHVVGRGPWVYKGYTTVPDWDRLVGLVQWFASLPRNTENALLATTVWPQVVLAEHATAGGRPGPGAIGILMPRLGDEYFMTLSSLGHTVRKYRAIDYLTWNEVQAGNVTGFEFPMLRQRLGILRAVAATLAVLHDHGLAYGDVNPNNIVLGPDWDNPRICFVDCDSVRIGGLGGVPLNAPGWEPPEGGVDQRTDCFKFSMLALRCLGCSNDMAGLIAAAVDGELGLSGRLRHALLAGLERDPAARPTIHDLDAALAAEIERTSPAARPWALPVPMEHRESALVPVEDQPDEPEPAATRAPSSVAPLAPPRVAPAQEPVPRTTRGPREIKAQPSYQVTAAEPAKKPKKAKKSKKAPQTAAQQRARQRAKEKAKLARKAAKQQAKKANPGSGRRSAVAIAVVLLAAGGLIFYLTSRDGSSGGSSSTTSTVAAAATTAPPAAGPCPAAFAAFRATPQENLKLLTLQQCASEADWNASNAPQPIGETIDAICARRLDPQAPACQDADKRRLGG